MVNLSYITWYQKGQPHNDSFPSMTCYDDGLKVIECWYYNGKVHRDTEPAITKWSSDGIAKYWMPYGEFNRPDVILNNII